MASRTLRVAQDSDGQKPDFMVGFDQAVERFTVVDGALYRCFFESPALPEDEIRLPQGGKIVFVSNVVMIMATSQLSSHRQPQALNEDLDVLPFAIVELEQAHESFPDVHLQFEPSPSKLLQFLTRLQRKHHYIEQ
ncbi:uncharacterized protein LACBIDRAFT_323779 [Laccaria bicolor S238N-H82]|uniref:Predicted protein n=1 Tax=Laccaria bicolor (strain S238N-H82 / ATCC MYA-4686) TaxID=486041 RepID=B0CYR9_LACBS|nr:uncharacterized protein LACBIDRAFT_323779 [Laccaria bicolor S238N-H82]EDR12930.1 predicted protein [Laccaria bicolor S238N-H82]|eukprot:XP_001877194.1 predicted protein [Laccaria bicolor S238N-H82]